MPRRRHGTGGRSLNKVLDRRREKEADVRWNPFVRPFGTHGLSYIKQRGSDGEVLVANAQGITFGPGTIVPVASHTGHKNQGQVIVGVPPPAQRGSAPAISTSKTVAAPAEPDTVIGFRGDSGTWYADEFLTDGTRQENLASTSAIGGASSFFAAVQPVGADPFGHVADFSALIKDSSGDWWVWDITNATVYSIPRNVAGSGYVSGDHFYRPSDGWVYWAETDPNTTVGPKLYRCRTNGTSDGSSAGADLVVTHPSLTTAAGLNAVATGDEIYVQHVTPASNGHLRVPLSGGSIVEGLGPVVDFDGNVISARPDCAISPLDGAGGFWAHDASASETWPAELPAGGVSLSKVYPDPVTGPDLNNSRVTYSKDGTRILVHEFDGEAFFGSNPWVNSGPTKIVFENVEAGSNPGVPLQMIPRY